MNEEVNNFSCLGAIRHVLEVFLLYYYTLRLLLVQKAETTGLPPQPDHACPSLLIRCTLLTLSLTSLSQRLAPVLHLSYRCCHLKAVMFGVNCEGQTIDAR